jgi:ADP-heptose:LPS heptosyltransferase
MKQKITLNEGVVTFGRMKPFHPLSGARNTPAIKLGRLKTLLKTQHPSICFIRGEGLGDVIMTTPTVHAMKQMFGKVTITYATNTSYLDGALVKVLKHNPDISHILERNLVDDAQYDLVVNLHCPAIKLEKKSLLPPNRIDIFAKHAGIKLDDPVPRYFIQQEEVEVGEIMLNTVTAQEQTVLVQPQASGKQRSISQTRLKSAVLELYARFGIRSIILTHDGDHKTDVLWDNIPGSILLHNLDIRGIAGVMVHCNLVLCPDSSILHLAAALGVPTVGLFGPTHGPSRVVHYPNTVALWQGKDIPACPCWYEHCPTGYTCWERISTEDIVRTCFNHLQNTQKVNIVDILNRAQPMEIETEMV